MRIERENLLLRVLFSSRERQGAVSAVDAFLARAAEAGCRGATGLAGREGFLRGGPLLREKVLAIAEDLPLVVEVIDAPHRIDGLLARAADLLRGRVATVERAAIVVYRVKGGGEPAPARETEAAMHREEEGVLLRVFLDESDRSGGRALSRDLLEKASAAGFEGGITLRASSGFGAHRTMHTAKLEVAAMDLPLVVELLGTEAAAKAFLPVLDAELREGLVTLEKVRILRYGAEA